MKTLAPSGAIALFANAGFALASLTACGSDANVEGNYTMAVTNGENGCTITNWTVGQQNTGIPVTIRQEGTEVSAEVMGAAGIGLGLLLGTNLFTGGVDGDDIDLKIIGSSQFRTGMCAYTFNADLRGSLDGDALSGDILYRAQTNDHADCAAIQGCVSVQKYNGTRPP